MSKEKKIKYVIFISFLLIPTVFFIKYYCNNQILGDADLVQYFSGQKFYGQNLVKGNLILWNKYLAAGVSESCIINFYPISILLSFLPMKDYIYSYYIIHLFIAGLFFYLYLKECGCKWQVSWVMAIIYECSIHINGIRKSHPTIIADISWLPVIFYFIKKFLNTKNPKYLYISALCLAFQTSTGYQYGIYTAIMISVYLLINGVAEKFKISYMLEKGIKWGLFYIGFVMFAILPSLLTMREYQAYGASEVSYDTFSSYSLHPIKLLQMVVPKFFGNIYQALGIYNSSEFDIEIYLGIIPLVLLLVGIIKNYKEKGFIIDTICLVLSFSYACIAHIPFINKIVYHIPVLGSFRCSGRMLFIFVFFAFSIIAKELNGIINQINASTEEDHLTYAYKIAKKLLTVLLIIVCTSTYIICLLDAEGKENYLNTVKSAFKEPILAILVLIFAIFLLRKYIHSKNNKQHFLLAFVLVITLVEVYPYSSYTNSSDLNQALKMNDTVKQLKEEIGNAKIWDAFDNVDGSHVSIISQNKSMIQGIASINSYTAFNNPNMCFYFKNLGEDVNNIPFNLSGLQTGSKNVEKNLLLQNDMLSMLGVKYIIDSSGVIGRTGGMAFIGCNRQKIRNNKESLDIITTGDVVYSTLASGLNSNNLYKVEFDIELRDTVPVDYLTVELYDDSALLSQYITSGSLDNQHIETILYSDEFKNLDNIGIRIGAQCSGNVSIQNISIDAVPAEKIYTYWGEDTDGNSIYINNNYCDIVYLPEQVENKEENKLYDKYLTYDLDHVAYIENADELDLCNNKISNIDFKDNSLAFDAQMEEKGYVCFSQAYSSRWKVYIDGEETTVDMVNGLIMGVDVPKGNHKVEFIYVDNTYIYGIAIFLLTLVILIYVCNSKKDSKKGLVKKKDEN